MIASLCLLLIVAIMTLPFKRFKKSFEEYKEVKKFFLRFIQGVINYEEVTFEITDVILRTNSLLVMSYCTRTQTKAKKIQMNRMK